MLVNEVDSILEKRKNTDDNYAFGVEQCWEQLISVLSRNEEETLCFLENCTSEQLSWISEVFEEVAENLQSKKYIQCLRELDEKFPALLLTRHIDIAESYLR